MKSIVSPSFIKQEAKKLKKKSSLKHSQALDVKAQEHGYSNYKHYLKCHDDIKCQDRLYLKSLLKKISVKADIYEKKNIIIANIRILLGSFYELHNVLSEVGNQSVIQSICEKANLDKYVHSCLWAYFKSPEGELETQDLHEFFFAKELKIEKLEYDFFDGKLRVYGQYDLTIECEYEGAGEFKNHEFFDDLITSGDFDISIDQYKKMVIDHMSGSF